MNAGDVDGSLAYVADDARAYIIGLLQTGMEVYTGKEHIRTLWQNSVANHVQWEVNTASTDGNNVNVKAKSKHSLRKLSMNLSRIPFARSCRLDILRSWTLDLTSTA